MVIAPYFRIFRMTSGLVVILSVGIAAVSMDQAHLWQPAGASFDVWVRGLAHSLIEYTNDDILRYRI